MSNDLISRSALEKAIRKYADEVGCNRGEYELANGILKALSIVEQAETAYDIDKVIEQLEDEIRVIKNNMCVESVDVFKRKLANRLQQTEKMLDIVKAGGIHD